jgi:hypothetical protein
MLVWPELLPKGTRRVLAQDLAGRTYIRRGFHCGASFGLAAEFSNFLVASPSPVAGPVSPLILPLPCCASSVHWIQRTKSRRAFLQPALSKAIRRSALTTTRTLWRRLASDTALAGFRPFAQFSYPIRVLKGRDCVSVRSGQRDDNPLRAVSLLQPSHPVLYCGQFLAGFLFGRHRC